MRMGQMMKDEDEIDKDGIDEDVTSYEYGSLYMEDTNAGRH